ISEREHFRDSVRAHRGDRQEIRPARDYRNQRSPMTAEEHNQTLATLYFIYGAMHGLTLFGFMVLALLFKFASTAGELIATFWVVIAVTVFVVLLFAVALLPLL